METFSEKEKKRERKLDEKKIMQHKMYTMYRT